MKKILTILFFAFSFLSFSQITVSGAGTPQVNGTYEENGTAAGRPKYLHQNGLEIRWASTFWLITDPGVSSYYYSVDNVATPDLVTTWILDENGALPLPQVTQAVTTISVSGSGSTEVNGTYTQNGYYGGRPKYSNSNNIDIIWETEFWYFLNNVTWQSYYYSTNDVATPDLVTWWGVEGIGVLPVPQVTVSSPCNTPAPTATSPQRFCISAGVPTIANLTANGVNLKWYVQPSGGTALDPSQSFGNITLYVSQTVNGCESPRTAVSVMANNDPVVVLSADASTVCQGTGTQLYALPRVDLKVQNGALIHMTPASTFGNMATDLINANIINSPSNGCSTYASGLFTGKIALIERGTCPFTTKALNAQNAGAIAVIIYNNVPGPTNLGGTNPAVTIPVYSISREDGLALISYMTNNEVSAQIVGQQLSYLWSNGATTRNIQTGNLSQTTNFSVVLTNNTTSCQGSTNGTINVLVTPAPTANAQSFCGSAVVAQLLASGSNLKWYDSEGLLLTPSTILSSGNYFVTQTLNGCESSQTQVMVVVNPAPEAPIASSQTFCGTTTIGDLQASGSDLKWYGVPTSGYVLSSTAVINTTGIYYVSQTVNGCESARTAVLVTNLQPNAPASIQPVAINPSSFNVDVIVEGSESPFVSSVGTFDGFSARLVASSYSHNNTVVTNSLPESGFFNSVANSQVSYQLQGNKNLNAIQLRNFNETQTAVFSTPKLTNKLFVLASTGNGTATAEITVNFADGTTQVFSRQINDWYNGSGFAIQGIARMNGLDYQNPTNNPRLYEIELNVQNTSSVTSVTFKKITNNSSALINVMAISAAVNATTSAPMTYCGNQTLSEVLVPLATGATANFYTSAQGGEALANNSLVASGTYYVSQTLNGCESARTALVINVNPSVVYFADADNDGFGNPAVSVQSCTGAPVGYVSTGGDCNDNNAAINPNAVDVCYDGIDNNCDGIIDNGCTPIVSALQSTLCGVTLPTINSNIFANLVSGAQGYRFRVTDMTTMQVQTIDKALRVFSITQLPSYAFDRTYQVEVSIRYNNVWQPFYGLPCLVTTPIGITKVQASQCGSNITNLNTPILANLVSFATGYRFKVTDLATLEEQIIDRPIRDVRLSSFSFATSNKDYAIAVAVRNTDGTYMPYGESCTVSTYSDISITKVSQDVSSNEPIAVVYPNPFSNSFGISLENYSQELIQISVYSMLGSLVESKQVDVNTIDAVSLGDNYPSGVYNVVVMQGSNSKTLRVVKR